MIQGTHHMYLKQHCQTGGPLLPFLWFSELKVVWKLFSIRIKKWKKVFNYYTFSCKKSFYYYFWYFFWNVCNFPYTHYLTSASSNNHPSYLYPFYLGNVFPSSLDLGGTLPLLLTVGASVLWNVFQMWMQGVNFFTHLVS